MKKEIDKDFIDNIKNDEKYLTEYLKSNNDRTIINLLEKLGRLENGYSRNPLLSILNHKNENIRLLALKNLAKLSDLSLLETFIHFVKSDSSSIVRREAVSAIGRLKNEKIILYLIEILTDDDPKVILQAIRGLLNFKENENIKSALLKLINHPNELIRDLILKEYYPENVSTDPNHSVFPEYMKNVVVNGDVIEVLKYIPNESIHLTFTSPPYYNARDYAIYQSYEEYLNFLEIVFKEVHRVTKEGRYFILNTSPIIIPRISRAHSSKRYPIPFDIHPFLIKMGWEFIDDIIWMKPEASVKDRNSGFRQHKKPLAYKPNPCTEMIMVYRKKTNKLIDWNIRQYSWDIVKRSKVEDKFETTNVWKIDPTFDKIHSAVFPIELCNRIIKYYSMIGDLVFDPFAGSGTLAKSAIKLERNFFLTEKDKTYFNRIKETLGFKDSQSSIFSNEQMKFFDIQQFVEFSERYDNIYKIDTYNFGVVNEQRKKTKPKTKPKKNDSNKTRNRKHNS